MSLSSCEATYVSTTYVACQAFWLEMLLDELNVGNCEKINCLVDSQSLIDLSYHPMSHGRRKHIEMRYHFLID